MTGLQDLFAFLYLQRFQPLYFLRTKWKNLFFECSYFIASFRNYNLELFYIYIYTTIQNISNVRHRLSPYFPSISSLAINTLPKGIV